mmetsp:Transcript_35484/g.86018  ORF Transcript_35484/g.86018 Transcript_35484/m.86018 type:complete len:392 (+) Transcript_35484:95-1270(+)|eukprot:CAMPEP_0113628360 /NCGR_PEP_ID=MMETSP0017_2-20120614/14694_1 /TAXON_ID=2856 /ORGANISM="Cylindrotheca closterium" /LENGTH=391 /DNA_ID=CAMNT_0000538661 /DNA_START=91 /DNA_END=1266 /DNA_ORIENTATION=+ /assembly_acc=CAM_ASM_000147
MVKDYKLRTILMLALLSEASSFIPCLNDYQQHHRYSKLGSSCDTFENMQKQYRRESNAYTINSYASKNTRLNAIIYGWDGEDSDETDTAATLIPSYMGIESEVGIDACPPEGLEVAMSLTQDRGRMGSFARLAAAFSPPERGIGIQDIEKVEVICVREDQIELEAILCENYGCVTLAVPIQFPTECGDNLDLGCAIQNLDTLDIRAETIVSKMQASLEELSLENADLDELVELNDKMSFPNWWVLPADTPNAASLTKECESIQSLLNEAEFHSEIVALAQDGMEKNANIGNTGWTTKLTSDYQVQRAKVAAVGPSGICMKVAAIQQSQPGRGTQYLDVAYPFSASVTPIQDATALRANVLGVIAAADTSSNGGGGGGGASSGGEEFTGMGP